MKDALPSRSLANRYASWKWALLSVAGLLAAVAYAPSRSLEFDQSIEHMFAEEDPLLTPYRRLKRTFGGNEIVLAFYRDPGLFDARGDSVSRLSDVSQALKSVPGVRETLSLAEIHQALDDMTPAAELLRFALRAEPAGKRDEQSLFRNVASAFEGYTHAANGRTVAVICMLEPYPASTEERRRTIDALRREIQRRDGGMLVGEPVMVAEGFRFLEQDGRRLGWLSTLLLSAVLAFSFRSLRWVLLALAVVQLALILTRATLVTSGMQLSMVSSMLYAIVTVIGVATVVHVIVRFRESRVMGLTSHAALARTACLLAAPVFWACTTDAVGFASLLVAGVAPVRDFGIMMSVAALAVLVCVGLLTPAVTILGDRVPVPVQTRVDDWIQRFLLWLNQAVQGHRATTLLISLTVLVTSALGITRLGVETDFTKNFRHDSSIARAYRIVESELGGAGVWDVLVPAPSELDDGYLQRIRALQQELRRLPQDRPQSPSAQSPPPESLRTLSLVDVVDAAVPLDRLPAGWIRETALQGAVTAMRKKLPTFTSALHGEDPDQPGSFYYRIMLRSPESSPADQKHAVIDRVSAVCRSAFPGAETTGTYVLLTNLVGSMVRDQWLTFAVAISGIFLTIWIAFRRLGFALIALIPNAMPIVVVMGWMGWAGVDLNMGAAMIAAVSVGLSVDSSIHFIAAYRRERSKGNGVLPALNTVQQTVGRAACFSTLALVVGFAALTTSDFVPTIYFGSLVSLAMLGGLAGNVVLLPLLIGWLDGGR